MRASGRPPGGVIELKTFRSLVFVSVMASVVWAASARPWAVGADSHQAPWPAPEFTHSADAAWINSRALRLSELEGRVVLVDFWTYGCWNCKRSFPWIREIATRFSADGLVVVGVHTPEFKYEIDPDGVRRHVEKYRLDHPVMLDNDFSYWEAIGNRFWPTFYLVDKTGRVRERVVGEVLPDGEKARVIEARIRALLAETI